MRALVLGMAILVGASSCGRNEAAGDPPPTSTGSDDYAAEQARFDAERRPETVVEALHIGPGARVADIGAGTGLFTVHLARAVGPTGKVVATDIDGHVLDLLAQRLKTFGLGDRVERRVVAADAPGLEPGAYDAILLAEVDHFFPDRVAWLRAAQAALKPGGRIVITNRIYHRANSTAAARQAGLVLESESTPVPTHYIAVFVAGDSKK
ncbi:MAG TPA: class I SAM-dependent methyltransferase [Kofleriaceae bacterium]|nr:class I SAM-dependent methyltransferase [Kofleriaceae bacterium]